MKIAADTREIDRNNVGATSSFTIKSSPVVFKLLSSGLYSDKIKAIVRELSCNAYDAHVQTGKLDSNIEIHVPNYVDSYFSIKDCGEGLSHDFMMNRYSCFFDSTKQESNDEIGGFGIGSKSIFAYTDSGTIISIHQGMKRVYCVYLDELGLPAVSLMGEVESEEPNGFEVKIPVKAEDYNKFESEIISFYKNLDINYKIKGTQKIVEKDKFAFSGPKKDWKILSRKQSSYGSYGKTSDIKAKMGIVEYPIDSQSLTGIDYTLSSKINNLNMVIEFPIGSLEITPSRESLSYTNDTIKNIISKFQEIDSEIQQIGQDEIDQCDCLWDARKKYRESINGNLNIIKDFLPLLKFKGIKNEDIIGKYKIDHTFCRVEYPEKLKCNFSTEFIVDDSFIVAIDGPVDLKHKGRRLKILSKDHSGAKIILLDNSKTEQEYRNLLDNKNDPIYHLSDVIVPKIVRTSSYTKGKWWQKAIFECDFDRLIKIRGNGYYRNSNVYYTKTSTILDLTQEQVYLTLFRGKTSMSLFGVCDKLDELKKIGVITTEIKDFKLYIVKENDTYLNKLTKWITFEQWWKREIANFFKPSLVNILSQYEEVPEHVKDSIVCLKYIHDEAKKVNKTVDSLHDQLNLVQGDDDAWQMINKAREYGVTITTQKHLEEAFETFLNSKPMLKVAGVMRNTWKIKENKQEIIEYINQ